MAIDRRYVSETDEFIKDLLEKKPALIEKQKELRSTWWDKGFIDQAEQKAYEESEAPKHGYAYFDYSDYAKKTEISNELYQYALDFGVHEHPLLQKLRIETAKLPNSQMQITPDQGQFMHLLVKMIGAKRYLELGVFTGYSSLLMALAMGSDGYVVGLDNTPEYLAVAKRFWTEAGVANQITPMEGKALESCKQLVQSGQQFDIAFIDANKTDYLAYYEYCYQLVRVGGLILVDNVLFHGQVLEEQPSNSVLAIKQLNEFMYHDSRVEMCLLPFADGISIAYKK